MARKFVEDVENKWPYGFSSWAGIFVRIPRRAIQLMPTSGAATPSWRYLRPIICMGRQPRSYLYRRARDRGFSERSLRPNFREMMCLSFGENPLSTNARKPSLNTECARLMTSDSVVDLEVEVCLLLSHAKGKRMLRPFKTRHVLRAPSLSPTKSASAKKSNTQIFTAIIIDLTNQTVMFGWINIGLTWGLSYLLPWSKSVP